jgi:signal transduction histidine kinase
LAIPPQPEEQRAGPRGPSGSSFVPGLVHELRNFIFGISGSLDAMGARFAGLEELDKYRMVMGASLGRLNAFLDELEDYGDPKVAAWAEADLEVLLREAAAPHGAGRRRAMRGPLPPLRCDGASLRMAFGRLIGVVMGQAGTAPVTLRAAADAQGISGCLDSPGMELPGVDLARLFEPFYFRVSGFGRLSLPVARRVIEHHGGRLGAVRGPGGGVRMGFTLPGRHS